MEVACFVEFGDGLLVVLEVADAGIRRNLTAARSSKATAISDHMPASKSLRDTKLHFRNFILNNITIRRTYCLDRITPKVDS
jgi:hypothetical protein